MPKAEYEDYVVIGGNSHTVIETQSEFFRKEFTVLDNLGRRGWSSP